MSKTNKPVSFEDVFLENNRYLIAEDIDAPRNGACKGVDPSIFFPVLKGVRYTSTDVKAQQMAIGICRGCSIRGKCLTYSLEYEPHGIWGGFTETQRALLGYFWGIKNKRAWRIKASLIQYRKVIDYVVNPEDINFVKELARERNFAQPPFNERPSVSSAKNRSVG